MSKNKGKLTLIALILMIFTSVFGFANIPRAFFLMGYSAIPWYIFGAICFFIPYAFMMAEFGAAFKEEKGGIYVWMQKSVGRKFAFIGTFMWFASYIVWMVSVSSSIWVPLSNLIFGTDKTSTWSLFGLTSSQTLGILGAIFVIVITFLSSKGLNSIAKVASIGGIFVTSANVLLIVGSLIVFFANGFHAAQPLKLAEFTHSPNPAYGTVLAVLGFLVFAIFAYGGLEAVGGLVDQTENANKTFPRGIKISAIVIGVGYSLAILMVGLFTNWQEVLSSPDVRMANVAYVVIKNLGVKLGEVFGLSPHGVEIMGTWFARYIGLAMFLALLGAFFTLIYSPLKQLIEGTPKEIWPENWTKVNENDMPVTAMWVQCITVVTIIIIAVITGGKSSSFLDYLILMGNVAMTIPTMFLAVAFIYFKKNDSIDKPFIFFKSKTVATVWAIIVTCTVGFANIFTILQPAIESKDYVSTGFQLAGPIVFGLVAFFLISKYEKKYGNNED
ncbi:MULTISPECIES: glutamate/gamma-aminobutyrate family transporter YjeM [Clostridia]|jgi:amino acid transporter|uniref:Glutamate/gamma-aminobutyrate family transporter YjeM n=1 Tax=Clostridium saudiense TaxID=1414720 RepID=A0ABS2FJG8_9CLOT|nr:MULTISPECIES: glutamate/gamma-aminobutyrate family transporter YjeM [Clostridiaceae]MBM6820720.1 glutamate/gamma-aminobutyrate family transporter YjeM [Clostridium saudiense]